ncbi:MAG: hypothetical protein AAF039_14340 [Bacteroidota bacterium]
MSIRKKTSHSPNHKALHDHKPIGLEALKRTLERDFFAEVNIAVHPNSATKVDLVIHLDCNFGLTESLFHLNNGNWGNFQNSISGDVPTSSFHGALVALENENGIAFDIKELSIHLRDTSIIMSRLPNFEIPDHLESILDAVSANFVHFTKGLSKMPYEIFVPIYEETENSFSHSERKHNKKPDYLEFWGLYFDDEPDSSVYDVKNKTIIEQSSFFLLNQWG